MAYRNDDDAAAARRASLTRELEGVRSRRSAAEGDLGAARAAEAQLAKELADLEGALARRRAADAALLDGVKVASPCKADWEAMTGDAQVRFCGECKKHVYNLSAMTTEEAAALVREREGDMCVRLYRRADGTMITADCPVGARQKAVRRATFGVVAGGLIAASALVAGMRRFVFGDGHPPVIAQGGMSPPPHVMMGDIAPAPPPQQQVLPPPTPPPTPPPIQPKSPPQTHVPEGVHVVMGAKPRRAP